VALSLAVLLEAASRRQAETRRAARPSAVDPSLAVRLEEDRSRAVRLEAARWQEVRPSAVALPLVVLPAAARLAPRETPAQAPWR
jgi:hypothetical protein